jgi:hypothetical protein
MVRMICAPTAGSSMRWSLSSLRDQKPPLISTPRIVRTWAKVYYLAAGAANGSLGSAVAVR